MKTIGRLAVIMMGTVLSLNGAPVYPINELTPFYEAAAEHILEQTAMTNRGYCIAFGAGEGRLAYEISIRSGLTCLGIDDDINVVATGRALLDDADLYGERITLHTGSLTNLFCRDYAAVLVVSDSMIEDGACSGDAAEMYRMVRPDGGIALLGQPAGCPIVLTTNELATWLDAASLNYTITDDANGVWARIDRGPLPGAGEWTHQFADLGNTSCSGDTRTSNTNQVLWFGEPGPRIMVDRHWKPTAPLYKSGRFIIPADDRIICSDAYNGARLWDLVVTNATRIAMLRDASWIVVDADYVYIADGPNCAKVDMQTGKHIGLYSVPSADRDWGYLAIDNDLLLGSEQIGGASRITTEYYSGGRAGNQIARGENKPMVTSKALFCRNRNTGDLIWRYATNSVIANPAICVGPDAVYFMESYEATAVNDADGCVTPQAFTADDQMRLVKLNKNTGIVEWRTSLNLTLRHIMYLSYASNVVLLSGTDTSGTTYWYHYRAYDGGDGSFKWAQNFDSGSQDHDHGFADRHPLIVGTSIYTKFASYDLLNGSNIGFTFTTSSKCADSSAAINHIYGRYGNYGFSGCAAAYDINASGKAYPLCTAIRPGCHVSIIPAGGLVLMPPFSAGCTCAFTLQTTIGWLPR